MSEAKPANKPANKPSNKSAERPSKMPKEGCEKQRQDEGELIEAREGETIYAKVKRPLGDRRFEVVISSTGETLECRLRGSIPRSQRVQPEDIVLVESRLYESDTKNYARKGTIMLKYTPKEVRKLQKEGKLPEMEDSSHLAASSVVFVESEQTHDPKKLYDWDLPPIDSDDD
jgi:translation initiation factor IF-1